MENYIELMARLVFELVTLALHGWGWSGWDRFAQFSPTNLKSFSPKGLKHTPGFEIL